MSDWKERAIKRRDFRHTHDGPEVAKHSNKKSKRKKPYKVYCGRSTGIFSWLGSKPWAWGSYYTQADAEAAIKGLKTGWWKDQEFFIKKK